MTTTMMTRCEDAPCCGCCGTNLYGTNESNEPEHYSDSYDDDFYDEPDEDECDPYNSYCAEDDDANCHSCRTYWQEFHADGMREDAAMESGLFGDA